MRRGPSRAPDSSEPIELFRELVGQLLEHVDGRRECMLLVLIALPSTARPILVEGHLVHLGMALEADKDGLM